MAARIHTRRACGIRGVGAAWLTALTVTATATSAAAQSMPLVCSVTTAIECDEAVGCGPYTPAVAAPTFLYVDLDQRAVTILAPDERRGETTAIESTDDLEDRLVLSGMQDGKGWSMVIAKTDGAMSLAISDEHVVFSAFGRCVGSDQLSP